MIENNIEHLYERLTNSRDKNRFPIWIFPPKTQRLIKEVCRKKGFDIDFFAAALLVNIAAVIGSTHEVNFPYKDAPILWVAIVGAPGMNKSGAMEWPFQPIFQMEDDVLEGNGENARMLFNPFTATDMTVPAMVRMLDDNPSGICLMPDELAGQFSGNLQKLEILNSCFSSKRIVYQRATLPLPIRIPKPFACLIGTAQKEILQDLFMKNNLGKNGFLDRVLFVLRENAGRPKPTTDTDDREELEEWTAITAALLSHRCQLDKHGKVLKTTLEFSPEAKELITSFRKQKPEAKFNLDEDSLQRIKAKIDTYVVRFCIPLHLLKWYCGEGVRHYDFIDAETVNGAIALADYFTYMNQMVWEDMSKRHVLDRLDEQELKVYEALPERFKGADGLRIAERHSMPRSSYYAWLNKYDGSLFKRLGKRLWEKRYHNN